MRLTHVHITHYKSITDSGEVAIDPAVTVFVGQNEAGKTGFLQALHKASPAAAAQAAQYKRTEEYPRRHLNKYDERHPDEPATVAVLTYGLDDTDVQRIEQKYGVDVLTGRAWRETHRYEGKTSVDVIRIVDEGRAVQNLVAASGLDSDVKKQVEGVRQLSALASALEGLELTESGEKFRDDITARVKASRWGASVIACEIYDNLIAPYLPKSLYFDDYSLLPGKVNIPELLTSVEREKSTPNSLTEQERAVLALFRMADVDIADLNQPAGYEDVKAKLEGFSNDITDQMFEFWTQNKELDVEFDLRTDPNDRAPFNSGVNLYIRIKNKRHRVTVPFDQRSKGFIWFFSFLAWFKSVRESQLRGGSTKAPASPLVLLLDEPGLSLHALAQQDLLRFIDTLAAEHQVIYTTHSPFMVRSDRFHQVRVVEDAGDLGTVISSNVASSSAKTRFPLQAALGYTIAQNLFISARNLLVEGPADLVYLQHLSGVLRDAGRQGLRDDVTVVPTGGLDKVATFIALLSGNDLELAVLHDSTGGPEQRLEELARQKIVKADRILNFGTYRTQQASQASAPANGATGGALAANGGAKKGAAAKAAATASSMAMSPDGDVEDLFAIDDYLALFNATFAAELSGRKVSAADLPPGSRIVPRIDAWLKGEQLSTRPTPGFNHYRVSAHLAANPPASFTEETLRNFEQAFAAVNAVFGA